jgi:preprotein translocase subunit SecF
MSGGQGGTASTRTSRTTEAAAPPRFFSLIPAHATIDFVSLRLKMLAVSCSLILIGLGSVWMHGGLNYGIDFAGGTMVHVRFPGQTPIGDIRAALEGAVRGLVVQDVGQGGREFQIRALGSAAVNDQAAAAADAIREGLKARFGEGSYDVLRVETVGPKVGRELWKNATLAVLASTLMMGVYIAFRFDFRFGIGAAVALIHDVLITIGALSLANMEFDLTTVAALLTVVGFSVNDTVIISDRIRENLRKMRRESLGTIINLSINETLSRTIITSGTAVLVTTALFLLGGPVIHSFAFALMVGFIVGTYSSIYVASPIVLYLEERKRRR